MYVLGTYVSFNDTDCTFKVMMMLCTSERKCFIYMYINIKTVILICMTSS